MSSNLEGRIDITLIRRGNTVVEVEIDSSRPQLAQRLMSGRSPEEAAELAGLIFSLCGKAQHIAAQSACEAARGLTPSDEAMAERKGRVLMELALEHAWRLLLDWPEQAGLRPELMALLALRQGAGDPARFADVLEASLRSHILGQPAAAWLARDLAGFDAWRRGGGTLPAILFAALGEGVDIGINGTFLLPGLDGLDADTCAELARRALSDQDFCARPKWANAPAETDALARNLEHPLLADWIALRGRGAGVRLLARLLELAQLPQRLRAGGPAVVHAQSLGNNTGVAMVETSRGLLIHVVRLQDDRVSDYRIVAPTEWNFHPIGPLAQALAGLSGDGDIAARAQLIAQSLDPCVAYGIEVRDA